jgi:uncharacterized protein (DUF1800 family)
MVSKEIGLMAHLMRRAGFGATPEELEARVSNGYEATVEELLDPDSQRIPPVDESIMVRFLPMLVQGSANPKLAQGNLIYRMITTKRPLEEKMVLFWHQIFATACSKLDNTNQLTAQMAMFRHYGMGNYRDLLVGLAKNPAMIFWLDNQENHKSAPNENWGRELLELFSMGQGNYTEDDVKMASRAFTGWSIAYPIPRFPYGRYPWQFEYKPEDHDNGEKVFLGFKGKFNGEDIIDIIAKQPATAMFIARHLYSFFVDDEVPVASWNDVPPKNPVATRIIADALIKSCFDIRSTLRVIFKSDFFKDEKMWFAKVKSPVEVVVGTLRLVGDYQSPKPGITEIAQAPGFMGQDVLDPPSVEGWHTGPEWVNSGSLLVRINFVADRVGNMELPGVKSIIEQLSSQESMTAEEFVDACLDIMGVTRIFEGTRSELVSHVSSATARIRRGETAEEHREFAQKVCTMLQLIVSTREYQMA